MNTELDRLFKCAIDAFSEKNNNEYPDHIIVYRDGVGDAMRQQVMESEISQFKDAIKKYYNRAAKPPKFTVIIVNKRVS